MLTNAFISDFAIREEYRFSSCLSNNMLLEMYFTFVLVQAFWEVINFSI